MSALHLHLVLCFIGESRMVVEDGHCGVIPKGCSTAQNDQVQKSNENEKERLDFPRGKPFGSLRVF